MGVRLIKIAGVYFGIGVLFGMYMSITEQMQFAAVHAHINLLGWASLALAGIVYHLFPSAATTVLAKVHFWLHNIGLPVMMVGLALLLSGNTAMIPMVAVGGAVTTIGVLCFVINILVNVKGVKRSANSSSDLSM